MRGTLELPIDCFNLQISLPGLARVDFKQVINSGVTLRLDVMSFLVDCVLQACDRKHLL